MKRTVEGASILAVALFACTGCTSYRYMREVTPELEQSRKEYVENNPKNDFNNNIAAGRVCKGMSRLQVRVTWGEPDETADRGGGQETWTYYEFDPSRGTATYDLRFSNGILQSVDFKHAGAPVSSDDGRYRDPATEQPPPPKPVPPTGEKPPG